MPVVVTHLSKYGHTPDRACLAGVDLDAGVLVRLKDQWGNFPLRTDLTLGGRHLALGDVIDFAAMPGNGAVPQQENIRLVPGTLQLVEPVCTHVLNDALEQFLSPSLADAFGCDPTQSAAGNSCGFPAPLRSLGVLEIDDILQIVVDPYDNRKVKISWQTDGLTIRSCLDDIRFYEDNLHPNIAMLEILEEAFGVAERRLASCSIAQLGDTWWLLVAGVHVVPN